MRPKRYPNSAWLFFHLQLYKLATPARFAHSSAHSKSTLPHNESIYKHLLRACLHQCRQFKTHNLFDESSQRQASTIAQIIHGQGIRFGFFSKGHLANAIIDLYAKCGNVKFAEKAFESLESKKSDVIPWNSILKMYLDQALLEKVVKFFESLRGSGVLADEFTYAIVLSASSRLQDVCFGKQVHCHVVKSGCESSSFCEGAVINMYAKCNCVVDARRVFDHSVDPDTVSCTALISGYVRVGLPEEALKIFEAMQDFGRVPDQIAFGDVISACVNLGRVDYACELFARLPNVNVITWNVLISRLAQRGYRIQAIKIFQNMRKADIRPTRSTLGSILSAVASSLAYECGLQIHTLAVKQGLYLNVYVGSSLINMYAKCERLEAARRIFDCLDDRNVVLWNTMLANYAQNGYAWEVLDLYTNMMACDFQPDEFTYTSILSACACLEYLALGQQFHSVLIKSNLALNLFVGNALVDMYAKSGALTEARKQFELLRTRDIVSWNAIIGGLAQEEKEDEAFNMFRRMNSSGIIPDESSLASVLSACANVQGIDQGKQVHSLAVKTGLETSLFAGSSLIDMYAKCSIIDAAQKIFSQMPKRSVASMNALIAGYAKYNLKEALDIFRDMQIIGLSPSEITFASLLGACDEPLKSYLGRQIHCYILKKGISYDSEFLGVSILGMYMNSQNVADAENLFSELTKSKSTVLWTAFISGYTHNDCGEKALQLFKEMRSYNNLPDQASFVSVLKVCSVLSSLREGREIHSLIFHTGFDLDELTCSALVDMYAKCGDIGSSAQVFAELGSKNGVITWNSMIVGLAKNGYAEDALRIFEQMKQTHVMPDHVTFLGVLTACSHAGRVSEGRRIFDVMFNCYGIQPNVDHRACLVDLLGRWGYLKEAEEFIEKLDFEPDAKIWASFLGTCKLHGDDVRGRKAAEKLIELEPQSSSPYILLSSIYAESGNWEEVNTLRKAMSSKGVRKFPGLSWITVGERTNLFIAGDKTHPKAGEMQEVLIYLTALMKEHGYVAETDYILHDEEGEDPSVCFGQGNAVMGYGLARHWNKCHSYAYQEPCKYTRILSKDRHACCTLGC